MRDQDATLTVTAVEDCTVNANAKTAKYAELPQPWGPEFHGCWWRRVSVTEAMVDMANQIIDGSAHRRCMVREVESLTTWTLAELVMSGDADADFVAELRGVVL